MYYTNKNLAEEAIFRDDKLDGFKKVYYKNGNLQYDATYKNGKLDGLWRGYGENGNLLADITFKNSVPVSGYMYDMYGNKKTMTNAHLHNLSKDLPNEK